MDITAIISKIFLQENFKSFAKNRSNWKTFLDDVKTFSIKQKPETRLVLFGFARNEQVKDDDDYLPLENIYVPLRTIKPYPESHYNELGQLEKQIEKYEKKEKQKEKDIEGIFRQLNAQNGLKKILISGDGGCGKSTFLKYLTKVFLSDKPKFKKVSLIEKKKASSHKSDHSG